MLCCRTNSSLRDAAFSLQRVETTESPFSASIRIEAILDGVADSGGDDELEQLSSCPFPPFFDVDRLLRLSRPFFMLRGDVLSFLSHDIMWWSPGDVSQLTGEEHFCFC